MKVTLLVPTVNEIEGMKAVMPKVKKEWVDEILVIDGGSNDGTFEYAQAQGYRAVRQQSKGLTNSYLEALKLTDSDIMIPFSPDGNSVPEIIPALIEKIKEGYDMVIVSRYLDGAKSEDDDPVTAFGNWMFTAMINLCFGGRYTDTLVMFRAWKREILETFRIDTSRAGIEPQLAIQCAKKKLKVCEIPGDEPKRIGGIRKMSPLGNGWAILCLIFRELWIPEHPGRGQNT